MFLGLRTAIYQVTDLQAATQWYTTVLGKPPYFENPYYVGFEVGGYELGLQALEPAAEPVENVIAYWGVEDIEQTLAHLLEHGATTCHDIQDVGEGILVASVRDPFDNVFGVIYNPHFKVVEPNPA